ncbi:hypothetical protein D9615_005702 [Tricholomella constricta]|uniref:Uncharacterized protein n=1 Tax=Tricholomella constricta TaxID=117010 RepID=A0A8H5HAJ8_9AGAR|nr:hypothetical protein D9615_005702 [Tricholomella constricta]
MPGKTPKVRSLALKTSTTPRHDAYTTHASSLASPFLCSDSDSDSPHTPSYTTTVRLRATIATVPETRLREIMVRLVDRSPGFQHAVAKELLVPDTAPPSPRRKHRRTGRRSLDMPAERPCANCGKQIRVEEVEGQDDAVCVHHPGRLEEEIYEFPSRTPEGRAFQVRRKITMWTCCGEDARSPGCASAPAHVRAGPRGRARARAASQGVSISTAGGSGCPKARV